jgi:GAF domain-containing protein
MADGTLVGGRELESPKPVRFDVEDQHGLEAIARAFVDTLA